MIQAGRVRRPDLLLSPPRPPPRPDPPARSFRFSRPGGPSLLGLSAPPPPHPHLRSLSVAATRSEPPPKAVTRSESTPQLLAMAAVASAPGLPRSRYELGPDSPATPAPAIDAFPSPGYGPATPSRPEDLDAEVASLSNKLISAINHQTHLDDALAETRSELDSARKRLRDADAQGAEHARLLASGALVRKADVDAQLAKLAAKATDERKRRAAVERDKKGIEQELENLTTALFEEANGMVAAARKEREAAEHRTEQVRMQLRETEALLASHQEQLAELKLVMERLHADRDDAAAVGGPKGTTPAAPSTPALPSRDDVFPPAAAALDVLHLSPTLPGEVAPGPPTSFSHLLSPVLRTDLAVYDDFHSLVEIHKQTVPLPRANGGSYAGITIPGLGGSSAAGGVGGGAPSPGFLPSSASVASLATPSGSSQSASSSPNTSVSSGSGGLAVSLATIIPLKETKFYKRALAEDIEPTLRLDTAPGLKWLARRAVVGSMCEGTMAVEPMPASNRASALACALCGEGRAGDEFARTHRFRTSESDTAQRYPLCGYCLNRVRACGDYLGFLRMVKDGHWRTDGPEAERLAWEESVRLRERMFWARIGGGVVPTFIRRDSPRPSAEETKSSAAAAALIPSPPCTTTSGGRRRDDDDDDHDDHVGGKEDAVPRTTADDGKDEGGRRTTRDEAPVDETAAVGTPPRQVVSPDPPSSNGSSLKDSLRQRARSRAASYERELSPTPERGGAPDAAARPRRNPSVSPSKPVSNDKGLQISVPGGFDF